MIQKGPTFAGSMLMELSIVETEGYITAFLIHGDTAGAINIEVFYEISDQFLIWHSLTNAWFCKEIVLEPKISSFLWRNPEITNLIGFVHAIRLLFDLINSLQLSVCWLRTRSCHLINRITPIYVDIAIESVLNGELWFYLGACSAWMWMKSSM